MKKDPYRKERVADVLTRALMQILNQRSAYFRFDNITVSFIKMSNDLRIANVYCRCLSLTGAADATEMIADLNARSAFIRHGLASLVHLKFLPDLRFHYDNSLEEENRFRHLFHRIHQS